MAMQTDILEDTGWLFVPRPGAYPDAFGGKAQGLARLAAIGERVPRWVALRVTSTEAPLPLGIRGHLVRALHDAGIAAGLLAVRSSAAAEDGETRSYAGQFRTVLGVPATDEERLWDAIELVRRSGGAEAVREYERIAGATASHGVGVVLQEMVEPLVSGVAFSADPVTGRRGTAVISAVYGLGEGLVGGELDVDTYRVDPSGSVTCEIRRKDGALRLAPGGGTRIEPVPGSLREVAALSDAEVVRLAACARRVEAALGAPQDLEWALVAGSGGERDLVLLQARPITAMGSAPIGERRVWDNSNIIESYHGVTTPLTFSFARAAYEQVYLQFCRLLGVEEALLERHLDVFANMLGLVRGRVYYNLLNWYRALSLLPGYGVNRAFMERMMGVGSRLADPPPPPYVAKKGEDLVRLTRMSLRLATEYFRLPGEIVRFHTRVEEVLAPHAESDLSDRTLDELAALYQQLEQELLRQWRAPLVNDFFAMIAFGVLGRLVERWLPEAPATLVNDMLSGEGGIISTEPAERVERMAERIRRSEALTSAFAEPEDALLWARIQGDPNCGELRRELAGYLRQFGDRCANELKLETVTLAEDPLPLLRMLRTYVDTPPARREPLELRREAERILVSGCWGARRAVLLRVLAAARERVRNRENLRFERTRVFGLARRVFRAAGKQLTASGRLENERDIFFLTREELLGAIHGTGVTADLSALARMRRAEFESYSEGPGPPDRFETFGPPDGAPLRTGYSGSHSDLRGTGCCPGVVRGPVIVVKHPSEAGNLRGRILVAERTDPGWTLVFPLACGLLVERGSLLSHSAIVAREIGLPCVVGITGLTASLSDGEWVEMDGATGEVRRVEALS